MRGNDSGPLSLGSAGLDLKDNSLAVSIPNGAGIVECACADQDTEQ
jgi:hypothetical protein